MLSPEAVQSLATRARTFDFFERSSVWDAAPERFRLHGVATQRAADRLATEAGYEERDRLMVTALLHDIGKLVLMHAYPGYPQQVHQRRAHARGAHPPRAPRARRRPRAGRRRARPPLGPAEGDRLGHRAPPRRGRRPARPRSSAWPTCSPTTRRAAPSRRPSCCDARAAIGLGPAELRTRHVRPAVPEHRPRAPGRPVPAVRPRGRGPQAPLPRARSTSRSRTSSSSRRAPCAPTCTTSTASSARSTARRPSSSPPSAAGSRSHRSPGRSASERAAGEPTPLTTRAPGCGCGGGRDVASATPDASISDVERRAVRPRTNVWWISSVTA